MGIVIPFPKPPSFTCHTVTKAEADAAQVILFETMAACPACTGRGFTVRDTEFGYEIRPCPCGGTDRDRIDIEDLIA